MAGWLKLPKVKYPEAEAARQEKQEKYIIQRHQWQPVRRRRSRRRRAAGRSTHLGSPQQLLDGARGVLGHRLALKSPYER